MPDEKIVRHQLFDRIVHWLFALVILTLLLTGLLPIFGVKFGWVTIHWVAGLFLIICLLVHVVRSLLFKERVVKNIGVNKIALKESVIKEKVVKGQAAGRGSMWLGLQDFRIALAGLKAHDNKIKPGKYSLAQKLMHHSVAVLVLVASITGVLLMVKIDTPLWQRNPYWLETSTWGKVYVLHGLTALAFVSIVMLHVYFSLRPEKRMYLRSMLLGWITQKEFDSNHSAELWRREPEK